MRTLRGVFRLFLVTVGVAGVGLLCAVPSAWARSGGIQAQGCFGCHNGGMEAKVTVTTTPELVMPGQTVTVTVAVEAKNGNVAGFFLETNDKGTFSLIAGEGVQLYGPTRVAHASPKTGSGGDTRFRMNWTAPAGQGGVVFSAYALSADGRNGSRGDGGGFGLHTVAWGCNGGTLYFMDQDEDGYGSTESGILRDCTKPQYYATVGEDCDDFDKKRFPTGAEICDGKDNDCNGQTDEGLPIVELHEDKDGDGFGIAGGAVKMGCGATIGWGITSATGYADCNDADKTINPGAMELCNYKDDNCNGRSDENARTLCGTGWCARYGDSCTSNDCRPGKPGTETCNYLDDDCDGMTDEGDLCPAGQACVEGECSGMRSGAGGSSPPKGGVSGGAGAAGANGGAAGSGSGEGATAGGAPDRPGGGCALGREGRSGWLVILMALATSVARRRRRR